jgi:hypothetical protein
MDEVDRVDEGRAFKARCSTFNVQNSTVKGRRGSRGIWILNLDNSSKVGNMLLSLIVKVWMSRW